MYTVGKKERKDTQVRLLKSERRTICPGLLKCWFKASLGDGPISQGSPGFIFVAGMRKSKAKKQQTNKQKIQTALHFVENLSSNFPLYFTKVLFLAQCGFGLDPFYKYPTPLKDIKITKEPR